MQIRSIARGRGIPRWRVALTAGSLVSATLSMAVLDMATAPAAFGAPTRMGTVSAGPAIERSLGDSPDLVGPAATTTATAPFHPAMPAAEYTAAKAAAAGDAQRSKPGSASPAAAPAVLPRGATSTGTDEATGCGTCATPDVSIAVGPSNVVEVVNSSISVYTKAGVLQKRTSFADFTGYAGQPVSQGRVLYDPLWKRWIIVGVAQPESDTVQIVTISVSATSNPTGSYWLENPNFKPVVIGDVTDHIILGMDQDSILFTLNHFDTGTGAYKGASAFGVDKVFLYNGIGWAVPFFSGFVGGTLAPPVVLDGNSTDFFVVARPLNNRTTLQLYSFTGLGRTPVMKGPFNVTVPSYSLPRDAHQGFGGPDLETGDARFIGPSTQVGNSLWNAHTVNLEGFPAPKFYEIDTAARTLKQSGFFFGSTTSDDWNATIVATAAGDAFVSWSSSDGPAAKQVEARFTGRAAADAAGTMQGSSVLATGTAARDTGAAPEPWGRWSGIAIDPSGTATCPAGKRAWVANEVSLTATNWGTSFGRIGLC